MHQLKDIGLSFLHSHSALQVKFSTNKFADCNQSTTDDTNDTDDTEL